jgi:hypothetical protein
MAPVLSTALVKEKGYSKVCTVFLVQPLSREGPISHTPPEASDVETCTRSAAGVMTTQASWRWPLAELATEKALARALTGPNVHHGGLIPVAGRQAFLRAGAELGIVVVEVVRAVATALLGDFIARDFDSGRKPLGNAILDGSLTPDACQGAQYEIEDWTSNNDYGWDECFGATNEQPNRAHKSRRSAHRSNPEPSRMLGHHS